MFNYILYITLLWITAVLVSTFLAVMFCNWAQHFVLDFFYLSFVVLVFICSFLYRHWYSDYYQWYGNQDITDHTRDERRYFCKHSNICKSLKKPDLSWCTLIVFCCKRAVWDFSIILCQIMQEFGTLLFWLLQCKMSIT